MKINLIVRIMFLSFSCIFLLGHMTVAKSEISVIVNNANSTKSIKKNDLKRMFLKKKSQWVNHEKVVPIDLPADNAVREEFTAWIFEKTCKEMENHWIVETSIGGKSAPKIVANGSLAKEKVASHPGGISYIDKSELDGSVKEIEVIE